MPKPEARATGWTTSARATRSTTGPGRLDHYTTLGGGIGYHLSSDTRVGLNIDYVRRQSPVYSRDFRGLRGGLAVTYGF